MDDVCQIIDGAQKSAFQAVNIALVKRNWLLGKRIAEEELISDKREDNYGLEIIKHLSKELTKRYGIGYSKSNLYAFYMFYKTYPKIFRTLSGKSFPLLSWSHYMPLLQVNDNEALSWYEKEAVNETWSVPSLNRCLPLKVYSGFIMP